MIHHTRSTQQRARRACRLTLGLAAGLASMLALPSPAAADSVVQAFGNRNGGVPFRARCERGEILTGLLFRAGNEFDAIAPICARAQRPSVVIPASLRNWPRMFGGNGGTLDKMECGGGVPAIRSLHVNAMRADQRVRAVSIYCGPVSADPWERPPYPFAGYSGNDDYEADQLYSALLIGQSECPPGEVGVGIHGRSGARVDRLGLICGPPVTELHGAERREPPPPAYSAGSTRVGDGSTQRAGGPQNPTGQRPGDRIGPRFPRPRPQPPR